MGQDILIFERNGSTLNSLQEGPNGETILEGTEVSVAEDAAALLNESFGTDAVVGGREVGAARGRRPDHGSARRARHTERPKDRRTALVRRAFAVRPSHGHARSQ